MIRVRIIADTTALQAAIARGVAYMRTEAGRDAARLAVPIIQARTAQGIDADGATFAPYTDRYKKVRMKYGRPTAPVDLNLTNHMMGDLRAEDDTVMPPEDMAGAVRGHVYADGPSNRYVRNFLIGFRDEEAEEMGKQLAMNTRARMLQ